MTNNENTNGYDILANVIMFIFKHDQTCAADIISRFKLSIEATNNIIETMCAANIIEPVNDEGINIVKAKCFSDINDGIIEFLNNNGFSNEEINDAFKSLTTEEKEEVSIILTEKRDWVDALTTKPDVDIPVVVRLVNKNLIYTENRSEVFYAEDIKIAQWDGEKWTIIPPYPKYDYSPITKFGNLNEGTIVSHWAEVGNDELESWKNRFNRFSDFNMKIEIDPEYEEDVYRALMWGAAYISKFGGPDFNACPSGEGLKKMYETLCDMQACIDNTKEQQGQVVPYIAVVVADKIVTLVAENSTNGVFDITYDDIKDVAPDKYEYNNYFFEIIHELLTRDEILDVDVDYTNGTIMISIDVRYCQKYEWQDEDEDIFGCSKEEWEELPVLKVKTKRGNN